MDTPIISTPSYTVTEEKPGIFLSHCPALDLYSQGSTPEQAKENIFDAAALLIKGAMEDGKLQEVLDELQAVRTSPVK